MGNWSDLCKDILELIVDELSAIEDIVHCGLVCRQWRSVSVEKRQLSMVYPWLMLAETEDSDSRGFYSLSTHKVYHMNLPEARGRRCWSSKGWLITLGLDLKIHLLNPFSRVRIRLPPQPTFPHQYPTELKFTPKQLRQFFIKKIALSSIQYVDGEELVVMAIYSEFHKLAFWRWGDEVWTAIDCPIGVCDIIYFNGQFYAVNSKGRLFICDISSPQPKMIEVEQKEDESEEYITFEDDYFLVESLGELFIVQGIVNPVEYHTDPDEHCDDYLDSCLPKVHFKTICFEVYKFNFDNRKWTQVNSLDNRALFVGNNTSFAIFPSNQHSGCEPNCIYYTDTFQCNLFHGAGHDMGVFQMETQEFNSHYDGPDRFSYYCTPLWICPSI